MRQTIEGIGGNFRRTDEVSAYTLANLETRHARVELKFHQWEPSNDDADPNSFTWSGFQDTGGVHDIFLLMQELHSRAVPIVATIWSSPGWVLTDASCTQYCAYANLDEVAEAILAFLIRANDTYGVPVDYVSFNEPSIGIWTYLSSTEYATVVKKAGPRIAAAGLSTKFLIGDNWAASATINYATSMLSDSVARPYLGPLAFHSWDVLNGNDQTLVDVYNFAHGNNVAVWATEVGSDAEAWNKTPDPIPTWQFAWDNAIVYYKVLRHSRASALHYWTYARDYELIDPTTLAPYPAFYVIKQLADVLLPGAQVVDASSDDPSVLVLAANDAARDRGMVQAMNDSSLAKSVMFVGLPDATLTLKRTSSTENLVTVGSFAAPGGALTLSLPGQSINTLTGPRFGGSQPPDTLDPTTPAGLSAVAVSFDAIDLTWTASTDNVAVAGYHVRRDGVAVADVTSPSHHDVGLAPSTTYSYTVIAFDGAGNASAPSAPASATTFAAGSGDWIFCANEGEQCSFAGTRLVRFGADGQYVYLTLTDGTPCTNGVFGDPIEGVAKACYTLAFAAAPAAPSGLTVR